PGLAPAYASALIRARAGFLLGQPGSSDSKSLIAARCAPEVCRPPRAGRDQALRARVGRRAEVPDRAAADRPVPAGGVRAQPGRHLCAAARLRPRHAPLVRAVGLLEPVPIRFLDLVGQTSLASLTLAVQNGQLTAARAHSLGQAITRAIMSPRRTGTL